MPDPEPRPPVSLDKASSAAEPQPPAGPGRAQLVVRAPQPTAVVPHGPPQPPYQGPYQGPSPYQGPGPGFGHAAPVPYPVTTTTVVARQSNAEIIVAWIFTALTLLYMLPWAIAASRRSTNSIVIAVATFFLAWTVLGWLVMLVLSFLGPTVYSLRATTTTYVPLPPPVLPPGMWAHCPTDPPHVRRWWDGRAWTAHTTLG